MTVEGSHPDPALASELPPCPLCYLCRLDGPGHCLDCGTIRLFAVAQPREIKATYRRHIWARDESEALAIFAKGTEWPSSYDEDRESVSSGTTSVSDVTETSHLRTDGGFEDLF